MLTTRTAMHQGTKREGAFAAEVYSSFAISFVVSMEKPQQIDNLGCPASRLNTWRWGP